MRLEEFIRTSLKLKSNETAQMLREMGHVISEKEVENYLDRLFRGEFIGVDEL